MQNWKLFNCCDGHIVAPVVAGAGVFGNEVGVERVGCESLHEREIAESGFFKEGDFLGCGAPVGHVDKLDGVGIWRICAFKKGVVPCADAFGKVVEQAVGAFFGDVYEDDASPLGERVVAFRYYLLKIGDVARASVEKNRVELAASIFSNRPLPQPTERIEVESFSVAATSRSSERSTLGFSRNHASYCAAYWSKPFPIIFVGIFSC